MVGVIGMRNREDFLARGEGEICRGRDREFVRV